MCACAGMLDPKSLKKIPKSYTPKALNPKAPKALNWIRLGPCPCEQKQTEVGRGAEGSRMLRAWGRSPLKGSIGFLNGIYRVSGWPGVEWLD